VSAAAWRGFAAALLGVALFAWTGLTASRAQGAMPEIAAAELPREARETLRLIERSGPYPYERDGVVFGNFERLLPARERGYYREYTVLTPGSRHRGARRIVTGQGGERYYTDDHYRSFRRIRK
jgi:ribonuclease T1